MDRAAIRRRNFPAPEEFPFFSGVAFTYDSGDYAACLDLAMKKVDGAGLAETAGRGTGRGAFRRHRVLIPRRAERVRPEPDPQPGRPRPLRLRRGDGADGLHRQGHRLLRADQHGPGAAQSTRSWPPTGSASRWTTSSWSPATPTPVPTPAMAPAAAGPPRSAARRSCGPPSGCRPRSCGWPPSCWRPRPTTCRSKAASSASRARPAHSVTTRDVGDAAYRRLLNKMPESEMPTLEEVDVFDPPNMATSYGCTALLVEVDPVLGMVRSPCSTACRRTTAAR